MRDQVLKLLENIHEAKDLITINDMLNLTTAEELKELSDTLDELVDEYIVFKTKKDKYILLKNCPNLKIGKFSANKKGFGFVILNKEDDLYIGKEDMNGAIQDDIVLAEVTRKGVKPEGHIIRIIKRELHNLVGEIIETKKGLGVKLDEEKLDLDKGIYVNSNMAYNYNIEVGDTLELEINVPYAMAKSIDKQILGFDDGTKGRAYHQVACIGEKVPLTVKVAGVIEMDSQVSNEIYLSNKIMTKMIDEQVKRYHDGKINLDYQLYEKYTTIIDLKPYAKAIFVDDEKHVEKVQKEISEISDLVFVYNEYQNTLELKNDNSLMKDVMAKMTFICIGMFILATLLVEIFYLKRYKSTYMIFRLNGYCNYQKNKIFIIHGLYQGLIILCMAVVVYVVGSLPLIIGDRTDLNISLIRSLFPDLYIKFSDFAMFSWEHFMFFVIVLIFVVVITYLIVWLFYQRQDIINYLEDESDENDNC